MTKKQTIGWLTRVEQQQQELSKICASERERERDECWMETDESMPRCMQWQGTFFNKHFRLTYRPYMDTSLHERSTHSHIHIVVLVVIVIHSILTTYVYYTYVHFQFDGKMYTDRNLKGRKMLISF